MFRVSWLTQHVQYEYWSILLVKKFKSDNRHDRSVNRELLPVTIENGQKV